MTRIELAIVGDIALNKDVTPHGTITSPGGASYYSAVGASHFIKSVGVVSRVGADFDRSLLQRRRIDTKGVRVIPGEDTCRFVITQHPDNTRDFEAIRGAAQIVDTDIIPDDYLSARYIHLPTQLPEHAITWLKLLSSHGGVSVDSFEAFTKQWPDLTLEMFRLANLIFTNEVEWQQLKEYGSEFFDKPTIIKLGKKGAVYRNGDEQIEVPAPKVTALETTGAGDVLAGAFLAQRTKGTSIENSLKEAVNLASLSVEEFGVEHIAPLEALSRKPERVTAALLINEVGEVFLGSSNKFAGKLVVPGGHFKPDETPEECALREVKEETGVNIQAGDIRFLGTHEVYAPEYRGNGANFAGYNFWIPIGSQTITLERNEFSSSMFIDPKLALKRNDLHRSARKIIQYYLEALGQDLD